MNANDCLLISGPKIYAENGVVENAALLIEAGVIHRIDSQAAFRDVLANEVLTFPDSYHLIPGFIDMHTHGVNGHDVMDATEDALAGISKALAAEGTTGFLATTMTASIEKIESALVAVRDFMQQKNPGAEVLGVHLEGPFLAPSKMGAQPGDKIIPPNVALLEHWQAISDNSIRLVTLAPEQPNCAELIVYLKQHKIIASLGHTNATYDEAVHAIDLGCTHATHLFNAMRAVHHREPGVVTAALLSDDVLVELVLDGFHLHPAIVQLVLKAKGPERIVLITDAIRAKCLSDGCYELGGQDVHVKNGEAKLADGTIAGSVLKMASAVSNMLRFTGCELEVAVRMASATPAKALGLFDRKGSIALGKDADLVVLDDQLNVVLTVCGGRVVVGGC
ncbi:MAG: N-acetylglucosamine-6-phosphate deacetylase [Gammaproteobacteria bacterium]|nr:N-acetylglucosamine-6-phosphate deacetylase [Gammaproteobacteria bacterium]